MPYLQIDGIRIYHEVLGDQGAPAVAITPGGRFSIETPGIRELGQALAAGGRRVLLWDRPNCGRSDISFAGSSESELHADVLVKLIHALQIGPTALAAGSAGSRVSLIAAARDPDSISHLVLWWVSGGTLGLISLANYYCVESALAASAAGMEGVAELPVWSEQTADSSRNRNILLSQNPNAFISVMERWAQFYLPSDMTPVPGMMPADFARLQMPALLFQNGGSDLSHTRATTEWVHTLIPHSELREPPWPDNEWNERCGSVLPDGRRGLFAGWPLMAPAILEFTSCQAIGCNKQ